jgi:hypothetical protein
MLSSRLDIFLVLHLPLSVLNIQYMDGKNIFSV